MDPLQELHNRVAYLEWVVQQLFITPQDCPQDYNQQNCPQDTIEQYLPQQPVRQALLPSPNQHPQRQQQDYPQQQRQQHQQNYPQRQQHYRQHNPQRQYPNQSPNLEEIRPPPGAAPPQRIVPTSQTVKRMKTYNSNPHLEALTRRMCCFIIQKLLVDQKGLSQKELIDILMKDSKGLEKRSHHFRSFDTTVRFDPHRQAKTEVDMVFAFTKFWTDGLRYTTGHKAYRMLKLWPFLEITDPAFLNELQVMAGDKSQSERVQ